MINTKQNLLTPRRTASVPVLARYFRPVVANLAPPKMQQPLLPIKETVVHAQDTIEDLEKKEEVQTDLQETTWRKIHLHAVGSNVFIGLTVLTIVAAVWLQRRRQRTQPRPQEEAVEMMPIYPPRVS